jgi:putative ABC transporter-associated repeat protein
MRFVGVMATALTLLVTTTWGVAEAEPVTVLSDVHTDTIDVHFDDGQLTLKTRAGSAPYQFYDPREVIFQVRDNEAARLAVPDMPEFVFLGPAGSPVWMVPQVQEPTLLFAGWDTESLTPGMFAGDAVDIHLRGVTGPGRAEIFQNDAFGLPLRVFSSTDPQHTTLHQGVAEHVHANWAFSALGRYELTFEVTATTAGGTPVSSGPVVFTWNVGEVAEPTSSATPTSPETPAMTTQTTVTKQPIRKPSSPAPPAATTTTSACVPTTTRTGVVLSDGHVDYAARIVNGRLTSQVKDGTAAGTPQWRSPSQVVFQLKPEAATTVPSASFAFLGAVSAKIWQIPQTQKPGILWLGWNTEEITTSTAIGDVTWTLTAVTGPGAVAIYELDPFGKPVVIFNSKDGLPDSYGVRLGTHAHGNWAFTASGAYKLTLTHSAKLASGTTLSDTQTVTFAVGDTDPTALLSTTTTGCRATGATEATAARLANTGVTTAGPLVAGMSLLLSGGILLVATRQRRT